MKKYFVCQEDFDHRIWSALLIILVLNIVIDS
jgi:hypothetical protein